MLVARDAADGDGRTQQLRVPDVASQTARSSAGCPGRRRTGQAARDPSRRPGASTASSATRWCDRRRAPRRGSDSTPASYRSCRTRDPARRRDRAASAASTPRSRGLAPTRCARGSALRGSAAQAAAVRRSCHTMAGCSGRPVTRSHTTVVSRWLVMPIARRSRASRPASARAASAVASTACQISDWIMLDPSGLGKALGELAVAATDHLEPVVDHQAGGTGRPLIDREDHSSDGAGSGSDCGSGTAHSSHTPTPASSAALSP